MQRPAPFSLALWATASVAHAQSNDTVYEPEANFAPMTKNGREVTPNTLRPMASKGELPVLVPLRPMQTTMAVSVTLTPMVAPVSETSISLTAMVTPSSVEPIVLRPMNNVSQTNVSPTTLVSMGGTKPMVMRSGLSRGVAVPVEGLPGLAPLPMPGRYPGKPLIVGSGPGVKPVYSPGDFTATGGLAGTYQTVPGATPGTSLPTAIASFIDTTLPPDPSIPTTQRPDDQLLVVDVTVNDIPRPKLLNLYEADDGTIWLPIIDLAQLLEIPLRVNPGAGVVSGWYLKPSTAVSLSMKQNKATIGEKSFSTVARMEKHDTDLYISMAALKEWFDVESRLDYKELRIYFKTPNPLPGDIQAKRYASWEKTAKDRERQQIPADTIYPEYSKFSEPSFNVGTTTSFGHSDAGNNLSNGLTLQTENDIYGAHAQLSLGFSQDNINQQTPAFTGGSFLIQKQSKKPELFGPLKATYFGLGDINATPLPLSGISSRGRGARLTNTPEGIASNPDQYVLTGPAPIGWDVEVYQNNSLVAYSKIDTSGTYRFTALPLRVGRNIFRIVAYGPNGETTEDRKSIYLGQNIAGPGEWVYDTALFQPNLSVIPGQPNQPSSSLVTAQAQLTTGLTRNWAATMGAFRTAGQPTSTTEILPPDQGVTAGLRGSIGGTYLTGDIFNSESGRSWQTSLRTPLTEKSDLRLSHLENVGFQEDARAELTSSEAELSLPFTFGKGSLDTGYRYRRETFQNDPLRQTLTQRTSLGYKGFNAANQLDYTIQGKGTNVTGNLETTNHIFRKSFRTGVMYSPNSEDLLRQFYVNTQLPVGLEQSVNLTYTQQLTSDHNATLAASTFWRTGPVNVGVQTQTGTNGTFQAGVNLNTAFVPDGTGWKMRNPGAVLGQGRAGVRVFIDENGNMRYDLGEPLAPNVVIYNRQRGNTETTDKQGIARFSNLAVGSLNRFELDLTTLPDIYLKPVSETLNVMPHTGENGTLNYALRMYGEVSGQARTSEGQPLHNLKLVLTDDTGKKVDDTFTESDGFYTFGALPMGTYTITPDKGLPVTVTITPKARILSTDLLYKKQTY